MKNKHTFFLLAALLILWCGMSHANNDEGNPFFTIRQVEDGSLPVIGLDLFLYDPVRSLNDTVLESSFELFLNGQATPLDKVTQLDLIDSINLYLIIDNRIVPEKKQQVYSQLAFIMNEYQGNLSLFLTETSDFVKPQRTFLDFLKKWKVPFAKDNDSLLLNYPQLDSIVGSVNSENHNLFILVVSRLNGHASALHEFLQIQDSKNLRNLFCIFLIEGPDSGKTDVPALGQDFMTPFIEVSIYNDSTFQNRTLNTLNRYARSSKMVYFTMPSLKSLHDEVEIVLNYSCDSFNATSRINHVLPTQYVVSSYVDYKLSFVDSLKAVNEYFSALDVLYEAHISVPDTLFTNAARDLIQLEIESILDSPNPDPAPLFNMAEQKWGFDPEHNYWYREGKIKLLKDYFLRVLVNQENNQLEILSEIISLDPDDDTFRGFYLRAMGDNYLDQNEYYLAVQSYLEVPYTSSSPESLKKNLLKAISGLFAERHSQGDFSTIYQVGLLTYELFRNQFHMVFYFGQSCRHMQDFQRAYDQYVFLINNWTDRQSLIKWDELLSSLEELSIQTRHFERALNTNIRIHRERGGAEHIENYLLNIRIWDYYSLSRLLSVCLSRIGSGIHLHQIDLRYPGEVAPGINAIYVINRQSDLINTLYERNSISPPVIRHIGGSKELILRNKSDSEIIAHLIQAIGDNRFLVIELSNAKSDWNNLMIRNILNNNMSNTPWDLLKEEEKRHNIKRSSIIFSHAVKEELHLRGNVNLNSYLRSVSGLNIKYMVLHGVDGSIANSESFSIDRADYLPGEWQRSSLAQAYFEQSIMYDGQKVIDIAIPLFQEDNFLGVIRMGFNE